MALRIAPFEVQALLGLARTVPVHAAMAPASTIVDELLSTSGLSASLLKQIELNLAAHFYRMANPEIAQEAYKDAKFQYAMGKRESGFASTAWGQVALALDTSGRLKGLSKTHADIAVL